MNAVRFIHNHQRTGNYASTLCISAKSALPQQKISHRHRLVLTKANEEDIEPTLGKLPEPDDARGAIAIGLKLTEAQQWEKAQSYFERALELPGTGVKRFRDRPRLLSDGEKVAALYNIACCQSKLAQPENIQNGLIALAGCLEAGYDNWQQLRSDPDLANLRTSDKFEGLLKRFERRGGFMGLFKSI